MKFLTCPECDGEGYVEVEYPRPATSIGGYGDYETRPEQCDTCDGMGELPAEYFEEEDDE